MVEEQSVLECGGRRGGVAGLEKGLKAAVCQNLLAQAQGGCLVVSLPNSQELKIHYDAGVYTKNLPNATVLFPFPAILSPEPAVKPPSANRGQIEGVNAIKKMGYF